MLNLIYQKLNKISIVPMIIRKKVFFLWNLMATYYIGFIIAWVVIISLFLEKFGVENLLWLFLIESILIIFGSFLGRSLFIKIPLKKFLFFVLSITLIFIILAVFFRENSLYFFAFAILAKSLFYPQFRIGLFRKIESFFTPSQGKIAIPIIESAETTGIIVGSAIVIFIMSVLGQAGIFVFWLIPILVLMFLLTIEKKFINNIFSFHNQEKSKPLKIGNLLKQKNKFIISLVVFVISYGFLFSIIEFEFLKEVNSNFQNKNITDHFNLNYLKANFFGDIFEKFSYMAESTVEFSREKIKNIGHYQIVHENLIHDLGILSLMFGVISLIIKTIFTRRVIEKFGIFSPILSYFAGIIGFSVFIIFGGVSMNFMRTYQHGFYSIFASPYHLIFYGLNSQQREVLRFFLEGIIYPLGFLLGVLTMIIFATLNWEIPMLILISGLIVFAITFFIKKFYALYVWKNFLETDSMSDKFHILEILSNDKNKVLTEKISNFLKTSDDEYLKIQAINTATKINDNNIIHTYMTLLLSKKESDDLKTAILESTLNLHNLKKYFAKKAITENRFLEILQDLVKKRTTSTHIKKMAIMNIFAHSNNQFVAEFLKQNLNNRDKNLKSICLRSCAHFDDPEIVNLIMPSLKDRDSMIKSHAIIALWNFYDQEKMRKIIMKMLNSKKEYEILSAVYTLGEIKEVSSTDKIASILQRKNLNPVLKTHCIIALLKMEEKQYIKNLLTMIFSENEKLSNMAFHMRKRLSNKTREIIEKEVNRKVSEKVHNILCEKSITHPQELSKLSKSNFNFLKRLYGFVGKYEIVSLMNYHCA